MSQERIEALRKRYANLCAQTGFERRDRKRIYASAYAKFPEFGDEPYFTNVMVDDEDSILTVTTMMIELPRKELGVMVPIGEFQIRIKPIPYAERGFRCFNRTGMLRIRDLASSRDDRFTNHPHVYEDGRLCINNEQIINVAIADGELLRAARYILASLRTLTFGVIAQSNIEAWHEAHLRDQLAPPYAEKRTGGPA